MVLFARSDHGQNRRMANQENLTDTSWFTSIDDALEKTRPDGTYDLLATRWFPETNLVDPPEEDLVLQSFLVRMAGLHKGIWNGIADDNPFATWPLIRALFELQVVMIYLARNPHRLGAVTAKPSAKQPNYPVLPGPTSMLASLRDEIPSGVEAYSQMCDVTHVGVLATWSAHEVAVTSEGEMWLSWSSRPRFRSEQRPIALGQFRELIVGAQFAFDRLAQVLQSRNDSFSAVSEKPNFD